MEKFMRQKYYFFRILVVLIALLMKKLDKLALEEMRKDRRLDKNDELMWKILHDEPLSETEKLRLERYDYVLSLRTNSYSKRLIAKNVEIKYGVSVQQAYNIIREATNLFGEQSHASREGTKAIFLEKYEKLEQIAVKEKDYKLAKECIDAQAKIEGLFGNDNKPPILNFPTFILSPDPNALRNKVFEVEEAEEISEDEATKDESVSGELPLQQTD